MGLMAIALTVTFTLSYYAISKISPADGLSCGLNPCKPALGVSLYFSIITETTLGYGDVSPVGFSRVLACIQVLLGLLFAGLAVAKITSLEGHELRVIAHRVTGDWIEFTKMADGRYMISFSSFAPGGGSIIYDGENFDLDGNPIGFFTGSMLGNDGNILRFQYSNRDSSEAYFSEGHCNLRFRSGPRADMWMTFRGTVHDFAKNEKTDYNGRRATQEESQIMNGVNIPAREELARTVAAASIR